MSVRMPEPDAPVLARREGIVRALKRIVPGEGVIASEIAMRPYESDGLTAYRQLPMVVVLPETTRQVSRVLRYCHDEGIRVVPRGAGTSLSGGALPLADGVLLGMAKFNRVIEIDFANRVAVVEPGVTNLAITKAVEHRGFYYAPDPSSQIACTIGGNVAENSGGVHCLSSERSRVRAPFTCACRPSSPRRAGCRRRSTSASAKGLSSLASPHPSAGKVLHGARGTESSSPRGRLAIPLPGRAGTAVLFAIPPSVRRQKRR